MTPDQPTKGDELLLQRARGHDIQGADIRFETRSAVRRVQTLISDLADALEDRRTPPTALKDREGVEGLRWAIQRAISFAMPMAVTLTGTEERHITQAVLDVIGLQPGAGSGGVKERVEIIEQLAVVAVHLHDAEQEVEQLRVALKEIADKPDTDDRFGGRWIDWAKARARAALSSDGGGSGFSAVAPGLTPFVASPSLESDCKPSTQAPFAHFQWNSGWGHFEEVVERAAGREGVFAAHLAPGVELPREIVEHRERRAADPRRKEIKAHLATLDDAQHLSTVGEATIEAQPRGATEP